MSIFLILIWNASFILSCFFCSPVQSTKSISSRHSAVCCLRTSSVHSHASVARTVCLSVRVLTNNSLCNYGGGGGGVGVGGGRPHRALRWPTSSLYYSDHMPCYKLHFTLQLYPILKRSYDSQELTLRLCSHLLTFFPLSQLGLIYTVYEFQP